MRLVTLRQLTRSEGQLCFALRENGGRGNFYFGNSIYVVDKSFKNVGSREKYTHSEG